MNRSESPIVFALEDRHVLRLPDLDSPNSYTIGRLTLIHDGRTLGSWTEQDLHAAINDMTHRTSMPLGPTGHLDLFFFGDRQVQLLIWSADKTHFEVASVTEDEFFAAVDELAAEVGPPVDLA